MVDGESYNENAAGNYNHVKELLMNDDVRTGQVGRAGNGALGSGQSLTAANDARCTNE